MKNPYQIVRDFEQAVADYTGAPFVVAVNSCTSALMLAVAWHLRDRAFIRERNQNDGHEVVETIARPPISIPMRTYISVPKAIIHAGGWPTFREDDWHGAYQLKPLPVLDCARRFTSNMYGGTLWANHGQMQCVSFQASKILADTQGGAILHDNPEADIWLRRARFDGRTEGVAPKDDTFTQIGWHCYMSNDVAARLLLKLHSLPRHNADLPNDPYPDLSAMDIFK